MRKKFVFATNNSHKLEEVTAILGEKVELLSMKDIKCDTDIPETADTLEGNALLKAKYIFDNYHLDCFADDTGLEVEALGGAPGVSQPAEHILKGTEVFIGNTLGDAVAERGKYHHRNLFIQVFDVSCHVEAVVVSRARHADDEVERDGGQLCQRLFASGNLRETGRVAQGERSVFIEYLFVDAAVIFQHESIVRIGYQKDVENAPCHEVGKLCVLEIELV